MLILENELAVEGVLTLKWIGWLRQHENKFLLWANRRSERLFRHRILHAWLSFITHFGGAIFAITFSLLLSILGRQEFSSLGWKCLLALGISHIPVAIIKYKFKRLRPYQALPEVNTGRKPLKDPSFPSGHTTAIFALTTPIMLNSALFVMSGLVLTACMIIAFSVGWSRMYLGLHYPSDVVAGGIIGTSSAYAVNYFYPIWFA